MEETCPKLYISTPFKDEYIACQKGEQEIKWLPKLFRDTMKLTIRINTELNCDHYTFKKIYFSLLWNTKFAYFAHSHSKKFLFIYIT